MADQGAERGVRGVRRAWAPADGEAPLVAEIETARLGAALVVVTVAIGALGVLFVGLRPPDDSPDGYNRTALLALAGGSLLLPVIAMWRPRQYVRNLGLVALASVAGLAVAGWVAGPSFSSGLGVTYLALALFVHVYLTRPAAFAVVAAIAVAYALVLWTSGGEPAPATQWTLVLGGAFVAGGLAASVVDRIEELLRSERALRDEVAASQRRLEAASRRRSAFLAAMSHELRTPLRVILEAAGRLRDPACGPLTTKQAEYVRDVAESGTHLLGLIGDVIEGSPPTLDDESSARLRRTSVSVGPLLASCVGLLRDQAERRDLKLQLFVDPGLRPVEWDEGKVRQILLNLLANAVRFTSPGGRIQVRAIAGDDRGMVTIGVLDTGPGIAERDHQRIFEQFERVGGADDRDGGAGLGLPLSRRLARLHGGELEVESRRGSGCAFWLRLPAVAGELVPATASPASGRAGQPPSWALPPTLKLAPTLTLSAPSAPRTGWWTAEMVGGALLFLLLPIAFLFLPRPLPDGLRPLGIAFSVAGSAATKLLIVSIPRLSLPSRVGLYTVSGSFFISLAALLAGPALSPFVVMFYVWDHPASFVYVSRRTGMALLAVPAVCYAAVLVLQDGNATPVARWEVVIGMTAAASLVMGRIVHQLWDVAAAERLARERIEGANAQLEQANRHKSEFVATMSHELRTPLNVIIGFAEVLETQVFGPLAPVQAQDVAAVQVAARELLVLINDVLDLGKLDAGRATTTVGPAVVTDLVCAALGQAQAEARASRVEFVCDASADIVLVDEATIGKVVRGLAVAAIAATPPGSTAHVAARADGDSLTVTVDEGGPVAAPEERAALLEDPFEAVPVTDARRAIAVMLAARFAEHCGGTITFEVVRGRNRWTLSVPVTVPVAAEPVPT